MITSDMIDSVLIVAIFLVLIVSAAVMDADDATKNRQHYCDMVQLYQDTGGQSGWPTYDGECDE